MNNLLSIDTIGIVSNSIIVAFIIYHILRILIVATCILYLLFILS